MSTEQKEALQLRLVKLSNTLLDILAGVICLFALVFMGGMMIFASILMKFTVEDIAMATIAIAFMMWRFIRYERNA